MNNNFEPRVIETSQLIKATLPYQWIYAFFGLNLPPILNQRTEGKFQQKDLLWIFYILYTIVLMGLVLWMVYINNVIVYVIVDHYALDSITSVLSIVQNIAVAFVQLSLQLTTFWGRSNLLKIHQYIAQLEQDILCYNRNCKESFSMEPRKSFAHRRFAFRRKLHFRCGLFLIIHCILLSCVNYPLISDILDTRDKILTLFCFQLIQIKYTEYYITIQIVEEFVSALQESLLDFRCEIIRYQNLERNFPFYGKLMANQFLLSRVWCLVQYIEDYFAIPMLILFLYNGVAITHTFNWMYVKSFALNDKDNLEGLRFYFVLLVFICMFWACWLSQSCIDKYNQVTKILHNLKINTRDSSLKHRQREFSLQLMHQKLIFTCWGFFNMNLKCFGLMSFSVTTYVFILIQFKLQTETERVQIRL